MREQWDSPGAQVIRGFLPNSPLVGHLGIELVEIERDSAILRLPFRDEVVTIGKTVHGGAIASLLDTAAMVAAWSDAEVPENLKGSTVNLSVNFLAPADARDVEAHASVVRRGKRLVTVDVEARTADTLVAKALVTYQIG
jgi:uncharacterized protein (TIGR00369 family)